MAGILNTVTGLGERLLGKGQGVIDSIFPPERRAEVVAKLQSFAVNNPKLAGFLLTNFALTGLPLVLFAVFTVTIFVFSLIVALLVGVLAALLFTAFMVGVALIVVLPTVFMTTAAASFVFLWGLGGYYILKWFNKGAPAPEGGAIGDKLNSLTGGRLDFLMDGARNLQSNAQGYAHVPNGASDPEKGDRAPPPKLNGDKAAAAAPATTPQKKAQMQEAAKKLGANPVTQQLGNQTDGVRSRVDGVQGKAGMAVGAAKGTVGGLTGLT